MAATVEFWGGVGVIGSSKVLITEGDHRVLLDFGLDIPRGTDLFRPPVVPRPHRYLADRLRVGAAPRLPGVYDPAMLEPGDPLAQDGPATAVFVSHAHIDHCGLVGALRPGIEVHAAPETVAVMRALTAAGDGLPGGDPDWRPLAEEESACFGPLTVERVTVDHDVPGASGYLVTTSDGVLAFTGDIRFHGRAPERAWRLAERAAGCEMFVTEGTALGLPVFPGPVRTEQDVVRDFAAALEEARGDLVLLAMYPRDLERVAEFIEVAGAAGRKIVWGEAVAVFLRELGVQDVLAFSEVGLQALKDDPGGFVYQPDLRDLRGIPDLADLPVGERTVWLHANGEPLGPFESRWPLFTEWLDVLGIPLRRIGSFGHATADDLHTLVHRVAPRTVVPIHTDAPERLHPVAGPVRLLPVLAQSYDLGGHPIERTPK
ncbi:beta-lactamase domain protein [Catenulispora acidiphila DSM 44928]|uniref:Beta-lactamase domain protein n=1 Tax=Catenulispora acidiphila (strain DSM 44928 / JCM 14897 / NBRC 102108 / NRRL B-24433 / ID139908) TaxID=479433 RepID=C7PVU7_CATAD|nr:MBL fold metallo-hydrolase [Catenulispora acidiphila]ACU71339.1 beta-lactamase domain protein [Catenulispora acidiphila DSM 44928]